uniref:Iron-sulfur cluster assembly enzyme n=1 Tax=Anolis carolinensis TaxID=28377 RepID=H9G4Q8_ANOCA
SILIIITIIVIIRSNLFLPLCRGGRINSFDGPHPVDENGKIIDARFKTFGCGSAIASSSLATEWVKGKTVDEALKIRNTDIAKELCLPPVKLHCSMLAEDAIKAALADYKLKQGPKGPEPKQNAANA